MKKRTRDCGSGHPSSEPDTGAEVTALVNRMLAGENTAANRALSHLLPRLRMEARKRLSGERRGYDLETDVLVETAVRRVIRPERPLRVNNRDHFMNLSKRQMNWKLQERSRLDEHRRQNTEVKEHHLAASPESALVAQSALGQVLERLRAIDPERYQILVRRDLHGESWQEIAAGLSLTIPTVKYRHLAAYLWLSTELRADPESRALDRGGAGS